ncbi:helix-turn-helix domain-containing protein [Microbacterium sp. CJ88]|uniref:helix-turn-helix domain-containing protein n=1 Tax=Microbacterium sp. CJ88 TaxID=3445672 RepID=UPI003F65A026
MTREVESLEFALGRRARELREEAGATLDQFARSARDHGLRWSTARVVEFEKGHMRVTLATLLVVLQALRHLLARPLSLAELVPTDVKMLRVTEQWLVSPRRLSAVLAGDSVDLGLLVAMTSETPDTEDALQPTLAETRAAKRLGVRPRQVALWSHMLWGWHLDDEARSRADDDSSAQERGHISRLLVEQIAAKIEEHGADGHS